jgi:hypothetical protein
MNRTALSILISLAAAGCSSPNSSFKSAMPTEAAVRVSVPGSSSSKTQSAGELQQGLVGQPAVFYALTKTISVGVNVGVIALINEIDEISNEAPAVTTSVHASWGPFSDSKSALVWKLDADKTGPADYDLTLSAKPNGAADSAFVAILTGKTHVVSEVNGSGDLTIDFSALAKLDGNQKATGGLTVHFDTTSDPRVVDLTFNAFDDGAGTKVPDGAVYHFSEKGDHSGSFQFTTNFDLRKIGTEETISIVSRWTADGTGRSDVSAVSTGVINANLKAEECWGSTCQRTYFTDSWNPLETEGDAKSCIQ